MPDNMRGLTVFIADIRQCQTKEQEQKRVDKEMANIRAKFKDGNKLDGYSRKKYVAKILYTYMLGYEIEFGHVEAVNLISSTKYTEKNIGYLACTILFNETSDMVRLLINSVRSDLLSKNEIYQCMALTSIANISGKETAEALGTSVQKLLVASTSKSFVKKKSALCLLRLFKKYPELMPPEEWAERVINLLDEFDLGVVTAIASLLQGLVSYNPLGYESCVRKIIFLLAKIVLEKSYSSDYIYYQIPSPWLQVKLLRLLQYYPPPEDRTLRGKLNEILHRIIGNTEVNKVTNHNNALYSVLFEAINLIITLECDQEQIAQSAGLLGKFISAKETNIRYLGLETMSKLASIPDTNEYIKKHQETIINSLKDPDISIRKRALDLLYGMCDKSNSYTIVGELLKYLVSADYAIREELVLKTAILAEKFAVDYKWYVDVILQLISQAGDYVSDDIWYRVVQIVTNNEDLQEYAAKTVFQALQYPNCHETAVKIGGYILGEFGHLIADQEGSSAMEQFTILYSKFPTCSLATKALLLTTFIKFVNIYTNQPALKTSVVDVLTTYQVSIDAEIQQRACEYLAMTKHSDLKLMQSVWEVMPPFPVRESALVGKLADLTGQKDGKEKEEKEEEEPVKPKKKAIIQQQSQQQSQQQEEPTLIDEEVHQPSYSQPPSQPPESTNVMDLLDSMSNITLAPNDPFRLIDTQPGVTSTTPFNQGPTSFIGMTAPPTIENQESFTRLVVATEGILYEDNRIQIGLKSQYQNQMGKVALYYGNKSASPLNAFTVNLQPVTYLKVNAASVNSNIAYHAQVSQMFQLECIQEFSEAPTVAISFMADTQVNLYVRLPITVNKFISPVSMTGGDFFLQWNSIHGKNLEEQQVIKAIKPIDIVANVKMFSTGLKFAVLQNVDPNPNNIVAAGKFYSTAYQHPVLIRVETNVQNQMYRVTVKSPSAVLPLSLLSLISAKL
jgi:AP-2 complex subunit alpha